MKALDHAVANTTAPALGSQCVEISKRRALGRHSIELRCCWCIQPVSQKRVVHASVSEALQDHTITAQHAVDAHFSVLELCSLNVSGFQCGASAFQRQSRVACTSGFNQSAIDIQT
jgi:hypothetical protein